MCGIAGFICLDGSNASPNIISKMTNSLVHRGPDGEGKWIEQNIALGHRRLAIIDLSEAGLQPMLCDESRYVISYNGEIYNFLTLKNELINAGYNFKTNTDTEVVLKAYIHWGSSIIKKFNGMFSIAIYDRRNRSLFLARDRYGIKPLYYSFANGSFAFASEIRAILAHPHFTSSINLSALVEYFTFQNFITKQTLFDKIYMFPQGSYIELNIDNLSEVKFEASLTQYWMVEFQNTPSNKSYQSYVEELDFLFDQAVKRQLVSDVDVGSYLSGGLDSGSIAAIAAQTINPLKTFTCGFDLEGIFFEEKKFDERENAELLSRFLGTEQYENILKPIDFERTFSVVVNHLEEPRVGQSYPNFRAAYLASKFVKVVLSGAGGDEFFGGYPWRYYMATTDDVTETYINNYYTFWQRLISENHLQQAFSPIWHEIKHISPKDTFKSFFRSLSKTKHNPEEYLMATFDFEVKTFLHGLLVVEDKLSMAHSLETRLPFLDNDLVDFAMKKIPIEFKIGHLEEAVKLKKLSNKLPFQQLCQENNQGKLLLRKMMKKYVPSKVSNRVKQGFSAPDAIWFRGKNLKFIQDKLFAPHSKLYLFFSRNYVQDIIEEHVAGRKNNRLLIWSFLNFEEWCSKFV